MGMRYHDIAQNRHRTGKLAASAILMLSLALAWKNATAQQEDQPVNLIPMNGAYVPNEIIVKFADDVDIMSAGGPISAFGLVGVETLDLIGAQVLRFDERFSVEQVIDSLVGLNAAGEPDVVVYAEPNYYWYATRIPDDPFFVRQRGAFANIAAPAAWDRVIGDDGVIIGVVDTGIDYRHPDLRDNMWRNPREIPGNNIDDDRNGLRDDVFGARYVGGTANGDPLDDNYHGTHVAGTAAAVGNNAVGVAGTSWQASLMALKFLDGNGRGTTADAIKAITYGVRNGAHILNNSWGGGAASQALRNCIEEASRAGILFVAAAGNTSGGNDNDRRPTYPASYPNSNILSVMCNTDNDAICSFSHYGRTTVDISAPGNRIFSTYPGNSYAWLSGTSMAAPHVSGAAALLKALNPGWRAPQLKSWLMDSAHRLPVYSGKNASGGRLDLARATSAPVTIDKPDSTTQWQSGSRQTVEWTSNFAAALCQSVDLSLSADGGVTYPYRLTSGATNSGSLTVTVPGDAVGDGRLRLSCSGTKLHATSEAFDLITPIRIESPDQATQWAGLQTVEITWQGATSAATAQPCPTVDVDLSFDGGKRFRKTVARTVANSGSASVRLPIRGTRNAVVRVACNDGSSADTSAPFRIRGRWLHVLSGAVLLLYLAD